MALELNLGISHLIKIGILGHIGRFVSTDGRRYDANDNVVCRTHRGLEVGSIMCALDILDVDAADGQLLRKVTPEDQMIIGRIDRFRDRAFEACNDLLNQNDIPAVLVDVEHLFDGQSLYFYFLGEVPDRVHQLTEQLANTYETRVRFRKFSETLANGCGPDCGTGASKCSTGGCGSCAIKKHCGSQNQEILNGNS